MMAEVESTIYFKWGCPHIMSTNFSNHQHLAYPSPPRFYTLLILEIREKVSRNRINNKKCLEMGENVFSYF